VVLGRSAGISEEKLAHVMDDPLPEGLFPPDEAAIVVLARKSTRMEPIDDATWSALQEHFDTKQIMNIILTIGLNQMVSRFHAVVQTDVDGSTLDQLTMSCPVPLPRPPSIAEPSRNGAGSLAH
jgi:alkylhydroperoxidase family enzyme